MNNGSGEKDFGFKKGDAMHKTIIKAKEIREELIKILQDPKLFERINKEFDKTIEGEEKARKTIFLVTCARLVENAQSTSGNLMVNDETGVGKDHVTRNVVNIWDDQHYEHRVRISPTTFSYWKNHEFNKEWTWDDKICYLEDISNSVVNSDTFKVMSSGKKFDFNESTIIRNQTPIELKVLGKPVFLLTMAEFDPKNEILRRFPVINLDGSVNQTKAVLKRLGKESSQGKVQKYDNLITEALNQLQTVKVRVPFAEKLADKVDHSNVIMRTNFRRFLDYFTFSAALHQYQREIDENGFILANEQDYEIGKQAILATISNKFSIPLTQNEKKLVYVLKELGVEQNTSDLIIKCTFVSRAGLYYLLDNLKEKGLIVEKLEYDEVLKRDVSYYKIANLEDLKISFPEFKELV